MWCVCVCREGVRLYSILFGGRCCIDGWVDLGSRKIEGIDFFFHAYLLSRVGVNVIVSTVILHR